MVRSVADQFLPFTSMPLFPQTDKLIHIYTIFFKSRSLLKEARLPWDTAPLFKSVWSTLSSQTQQVLMSHSNQYPALQTFISWSVAFGLLVTEWKAVSIQSPVHTAEWITAFVLPQNPKDKRYFLDNLVLNFMSAPC